VSQTLPNSVSSVVGTTDLAESTVGAADSGEATVRETPAAQNRIPAWVPGPRLLLTVVALVVVLVSLPLLQSVALKENEVDALRALKLLGAALQGPEVHAADGSPRGPALSALVGPDSSLGKRLPDSRLLNEGRLMLHHGYLFELVPESEGTQRLRAWPMSHGETGLGVFLWDGSGEIIGHNNSEARWSGPDAAPDWPTQESYKAQAWQPVNLPPSQRSPSF
jgi:hypothetical protein